MKRFAKIAVMLAVYLTWICGNGIIAISCHANSTHHTHCCKMCECHHDNCEEAHFEAPHACNHDHSNKVALYNTAKRNSLNIEPVTLCIAAQLDDTLRIEEIASLRTSHHYDRGAPLPPSPTLSRRGMRAPPIVA